MNKIFYIRRPNKFIDGATILDNKIVNNLSKSYDLIEYFIEDNKKFNRLPIWKYKLGNNIRQELTSIDLSNTKVIVSHECLYEVCDYIRVDIFIFHNLFSQFDSNYVILRFLYRLRSKSSETRIFNSVHGMIIVLSERERSYLSSSHPKLKVRRLIPGSSLTFSKYCDISNVVISGTYDWLPKRLSKPPKSVLRRLEEMGFKLSTDYNQKLAGVSLIVDRFLVGFKLKLAQAIQRGDIIISFVDLGDELMVFKDFDERDYFLVRTWDELLDLMPQINCRHRVAETRLLNWENNVKEVFQW